MRILTLLILASCLYSPALSAAIGVPPTKEASTEITAQEALKKHKAEVAALSPSERRELRRSQRKELKQAVRQYRQDVKNGLAEPSTNQLLLIILAILLPPVAVLAHEGEINNKFWLALILTILGFLPGVIYALIVVLGDAKK